MKRREFVAATAAVTVASAPRSRAAPAARAAPPVEPVARAFDLSRVRLGAGPFLDAALVNRRFVMGMDPDRLLHTFRLTAGLPSAAEPLGGWEAPDNELRGHYTGHYLSACALMSASLGDAEVKARGDLMVAELARCQQALNNGYLSAFPEEFFDRLRDGRPVWAPFYTVHKIMAGLLDMHTLAGNAQALEVLRGMARWTDRWSQPLGDAAMQRVLEREYGGMNEMLYNLSAVTNERQWRAVAHRFDHERFFAPLAAGRDELKGLHANTNVPKVIGAARRYELLGDPRARSIAEYFWHEIVSRRSYATGGTSNGEGWNTDPGLLANELSGYTQECCVSYNMRKLTKHVFSWTADPAAADYDERLLFNAILGAQHPGDGSKLYYVPLASGYWKLFGNPLHDFWCCTGTGSESFSKLAETIYWQDADGLFVNQFIASELDWQERGVRIVQQTRFPEEEGTMLVVRAPQPARFALRVRVPYWAHGGGASLNGRALEGFASPGGYYSIERTWRDGDRLQVALPMALHVHPMPDDAALQALMFGPMVLVGRLGSEGLTPETLRAEPTAPRQVPRYRAEPVAAPALQPAGELASWIQRVPGRLEFHATGQPREITLVPFHTLFDERYAVYWRMQTG